MATAGPKPKPTVVRLVNGTHRPHRHGDVDQVKADLQAAAEDFGPLVRPKELVGHALTCWKKQIEPARWLDASKATAAQLFCELYAEWCRGPDHFTAGKHAQIRAYMAELGLTDERNRGKAEKKVRDEFFDD